MEGHMRESTEQWAKAAATACFVIGLMLILNETQSTGEAVESFRLSLRATAPAILGLAMMVLGVVAFIAILLREKGSKLRSGLMK